MSTTKFPEYLAFGKLNPTKIREAGERRTANYEFLNHKVMELVLMPDNVEIHEFHDDKSYSIGYGSELKRAFLHHFTCRPVGSSPNMELLANEVCKLGNIYFQRPSADKDKPIIVYYPAASLLNVRVPVGEDNLANAMNFIDADDNERLVQAYYSSRLIIRYPGIFEPRIEPVDIMELIVPIAYVYDRVKLLTEYGVISDKKTHRAIIQDVSAAMNDIRVSFTGTLKDEWSRYEIELKNKYLAQ